MSPLIDVIVPVYGVEDYLEKCVDSLLRQTFTDYVITLVDDGSPDRCPEICDRYQAQYPERVRVIHKENGGLSDARNAGVARSDAVFVVFVDSDDYVSETFLEDLYRGHAQDGGDVVVAQVAKVYPDQGDNCSKPETRRLVMDRDTAIEKLCYEAEFTGYAHNKLIPRQLALDIPFPKGRYYEDSFTVYRWLYRSSRVVCIPEVDYFYLQRQGSIQRSAFQKKHLDLMDAVQEMLDFYTSQGVPRAVMQGAEYRYCWAAYVTLRHACSLPYEAFAPVAARYQPAVRHYLASVLRNKHVSLKRKLVFLLLGGSKKVFYNIVGTR